MSAIYYLVASDLQTHWGATTYEQLFGDATGTVDTTAVNAVISRASVRVTSKMPHNYSGVLPFPSPYPEVIKDAVIEYCRAFAYERNPDLMRERGLKYADMIKVADGMMEEIRHAIIRLIDAAAPTPTNVGGAVGTIGDQTIETPVQFFSSMGDW